MNSPLTELCYKLLKKQNYIIDDSMTTTGSLTSFNAATSVSSALGSVVQQGVQKYKENQTSIESLAKDVKTKQTNYKASAQLLKDRAANHATQRKYEFVALAMFLVVAVGAAIVLTLPMDRQHKFMGCGLLATFAVINAFILNYLKNAASSVEGFVGYTMQDKSASSYELAALKEASAYIDNTIGLAHLLESYRAYGNLNQAIGKEINYYYDASEQLQIANRKVEGVNNTSYLQDLQYSSMMNLLTTLSIIVAGMTTLQVATEPIAEKNPIVPKIVVGTGGTLAVISFTLYLLETSFRVHTKPKQFYWNNPSPNRFS